MRYFAGIFDAEGYVSLMNNGHFIIGMDMTNETVVNLFKEHFNGSTYKQIRSNRKPIFAWRIPSNRGIALNFIEKVSNYSFIKKPQLVLLKEYLMLDRISRKNLRKDYISKMAFLKIPSSISIQEIKTIYTDCVADICFWEWFAGFLDGDGCISIYEYKQKTGTCSFDCWIGIFNTFPEPIILTQKRINGSISQYKGNKFPIWKWVCSEKSTSILCNCALTGAEEKPDSFTSSSNERSEFSIS